MPKFWLVTSVVVTATVSLLSGVASGVPYAFSPVVTQLAGSAIAGAGCPTVPRFVVSCSVYVAFGGTAGKSYVPSASTAAHATTLLVESSRLTYKPPAFVPGSVPFWIFDPFASSNTVPLSRSGICTLALSSNGPND